jgi:hypothetical protein
MSSQNIDIKNSIYSRYLKNNLKYWMSGNERINIFIQDKQLKIKNYNDVVFEWIPYNQFYEIKETGRNDFITVYSAIWKDGPLYYDNYGDEYTRYLNKEVALKCLHNSTNPIEFVINEVLYNISEYLKYFFHLVYLLLFPLFIF